MNDTTHTSMLGGTAPPSKHQLALMIWLAVLPTLTVLNLAFGDWLHTLTTVDRTFVLATMAVPIVSYGLMPPLHRIRRIILTRLVRSSGAGPTPRATPMRTDRVMTATPRRTPMKAITQDRYGSADVLRLRDVAEPTPGEHEVLVRVQAAGMARGVLHVMTGEPYLMRLVGFGLLKPKNPIPGQDVAGTVTAVGDGVTRFDVGDEVFGVAKGSFAEYAVAREDKLSHKPDTLSFEQAAAMPISGLTALGALDAAGVTGGSNVLIVGASGGVGTYAVQIAVALGATVTGVASGAKADLVTALGARHVIDYTREDFADGSQTYDVVVDTGGMTSVSRLRRALRPQGTLVIVGGENGSTWSPGMGRQLKAAVLSPIVSQRLTSILNKEHYTGLDRLAELAAHGDVAPCIERSYPLAEVPDAVRRLEAGEVRGQIVVTP